MQVNCEKLLRRRALVIKQELSKHTAARRRKTCLLLAAAAVASFFEVGCVLRDARHARRERRCRFLIGIIKAKGPKIRIIGLRPLMVLQSNSTLL